MNGNQKPVAQAAGPRKKRPYHRSLKGTTPKSRARKKQAPPNPNGGPLEALLAASRAARVSENRVEPGTPKGMTKAAWNAQWGAAKAKAGKLLEEMEKLGLIDNSAPIDTDEGRANAALGYAIAVVITDQLPVKDRLAAAKIVLDFTKAKPATKSEVTVNAAEAFLAGILNDGDEA